MQEPIFADAVAAQRAGEFEKAARLCREILKSQRSFEALYLLGFVLTQLNQNEEAERLIAEAIWLNPRSPDAYYNRGCLLMRLNRLEESIGCFESALAIKPDYAGALLNHGFARLKTGYYAESLTDFDSVLRLSPNYVPALVGRGSALCELRKAHHALAAFDLALRLDTNNLLARAGRATALLQLGKGAEAVVEFDRILARSPESTETLINRAAALFELKRLDEAARDYRNALTLAPDFPYLLGQSVYCQLHACDWTGLEQARRAVAAAMDGNNPAILPFANLALSSSAAEQLQCARISARLNAHARSPLWRGDVYRHGRIRIAYLSADFHAHATTHLMAGVFECQDRRRFETIAVSYGPDDMSETRARLPGMFDRFVDVRSKSDFEVASLIRNLEADIVVDLKGLTKEARPGISAFRAAPIQAQYLGYPGTTALPNLDYIIADRIVIPEDHQQFYSEAVVYLPDTYQCNAPIDATALPAKSRAEHGLPEDGFVFCCFNNAFKIGPDVFSTWMRLLGQVEGSALWLIGGNAMAQNNLARAAAEHGIDPARLIFAPRAGVPEHLARQGLADLFLDTLPYGAHTTASDALRMGVPVLTCLGGSFQGRVAASLLHAVGLPELICTSLSEYEAMALNIAQSPALGQAIKQKLWSNQKTCPLFDTVRFTRNLETAFDIMIARARRGEPPASFGV